MHDLDDHQWRELLQRLRRFALWLTREASSADDLVQATVERALSRRGQQRDGQPAPWLFTILTGCFRRQTPRTPAYALAGLVRPQPGRGAAGR
jgi:RNA polymerase sigma-70 factor (ECF subfamily)